MNLLQTTNIEIINQLIGLLRQLPAGIYHEPLRSLHQHSIGQHTRHIVEFYQCLLKGLAEGEVNYDARERNLRIETDKSYALQVLEDSIEQITQLWADKPMMLKQAFGTSEVQQVSTSFFRELTYLIEHTIHHLAIIKIGLTETYPDICLSANFGLAHSTIQYRASQQTSA
jgi:uncharacterized damage-inducible protein DinB